MRMSTHAAHFPVAAIDLALCRRPVVIAALSDRPAMISRGKWGGGGGGAHDGEELLIIDGEINHPHWRGRRAGGGGFG